MKSDNKHSLRTLGTPTVRINDDDGLHNEPSMTVSGEEPRVSQDHNDPHGIALLPGDRQFVFVMPGEERRLASGSLSVGDRGAGSTPCTLELDGPVGGDGVTRFEGVVVERMGGWQVILVHGDTGAVCTIALAARALAEPIMDGLVTFSGWPAPDDLLACRCLLIARGRTDDPSRLLARLCDGTKAPHLTLP